MEKALFNQITKKIFLEYGFDRQNEKYVLSLQDITIVARLRSWRGVKYFAYIFYINYPNEICDKQNPDTLIEIKMEHNFLTAGYHRHEIKYEEYAEEEYRDLLTRTIHLYFDPYKENAIRYLKNNAYRMCLSPKANRYLGLC